MAVNKEQPVPSSFTKCECASQKNAAISSQDQRKFTLAEEFPNPVRELKTVAANFPGIPHLDGRIEVAGISRRNNGAGILGPQSLNDAMRPERGRHILHSGLLSC